MDRPTFDERVEQRLDRLSPAERRAALFFKENRQEVLVASAAVLAAKADTSDATIVRTSRALGFASLDELRRTIAGELQTALSPAGRLTRTLADIGGSLAHAFEATLQIHQRSLESLGQSVGPARFEEAVGLMIAARRVVFFGLGPSSAMAAYMVTQLMRLGLDAQSLTHTGSLFADDLQKLREGDLVIVLAYGRVYAELAVLLDEARRRGLAAVLITDTLAARLRNRVDVVLPVPRGQAEMLSMHTATLGLLEALLVGVASQRPQEALASLERLNEMRERLAGRAMRLPVPASAPGDEPGAG